MEFEYIASTQSGKIVRGQLAATTKERVASQLQQQNLSIISILPKEQRIVAASRVIRGTFRVGHVPLMEKIIFARLVANMLRSGMSLVEALDILQSQTTSKRMQAIVQQVMQSVSNGKSLAASLQQFPAVFGGLIIGMVKVGEASGTLEQNLDYVAHVLEKDYDLRKKVTSAMIYPAIVLSATLILGTGLTIFILPKLVKMFSTFRLELPLITKIFLAVANFLVHDGYFVLGGIVVLGIVLRVLIRARATKPFFHRLNLTMPIIKRTAHFVNLARLCRVLGLLLRSGVTINESLAITSQVVDNVHYQQQLEIAGAAVQRGKSLGAILTDERYIPRMANRMIVVGEKTGRLPETFSYLADFYEEELDHATKNLSTVIEPMLLVFIGVVLGFLAVAIISPIYQFTGSLKR